MAELGYKTTIRIPRELLKAARMKALELDVTLSEAIRELLRRWVAGEIELSIKKEESQNEEK